MGPYSLSSGSQIIVTFSFTSNHFLLSSEFFQGEVAKQQSFIILVLLPEDFCHLSYFTFLKHILMV